MLKLCAVCSRKDRLNQCRYRPIQSQKYDGWSQRRVLCEYMFYIDQFI